jgi:hypothetical protein
LSYIGQQPVVGRYIKIDQISGGFNGTASGFTLAAGGQGVLPGTARNLMLSLGGVIQEPEVDFTTSGSGITFTTPPVSGTTFFCVVFGDMQAIGQPSDGTVIPASIAASGIFTFPDSVNVNGSGFLKIPIGTEATRPAGNTGYIRYNTTTSQFEGYSSAWGALGGGATGSGGDRVFVETSQTVTTSYTLTSGYNAITATPLTVASGVTVTVPSGAAWVLV